MKIFTFATKNFSRRLAYGFGAVGVVLLVLVGTIRWGMLEVGNRTQLVIDTRLPTVQASQQLLSGVNQSLAGLRGYMLLGKDAFKTERADAWAKDIDPALRQLQTLAARWTNPRNKQLLKEVEQILPEFRQAQTEIEGVTATDATQAKEWLGSRAAPRAFKIKELMTQMVQSQQELVAADGHAVRKSIANLSHTLMILFLLAAGIAVGVSVVTTRAVVRPLREMIVVAEQVARGDLTVRIEQRSQDEAGQLAAAFKRMVESLRELLGQVGNNAQALASASEELTVVSQQMSANAEETSMQANVVAASGEQVSKNVQTVAAGSEEMSASIKEIAKNASDAARVASQAVQVAQTTSDTITQLGVSSQEIGNVIKVITSIAEQTNLLALNATIEAARAGEAGKGFAVVANEVKELAKQTAEATEDIGRKIGSIQSDTQGAVTAVEQISGIINQINDIANTIASAVEEQSVTTAEMARNVEEAAKGSGEIARNITGVAQAAQSTASGATETQASAQDLTRMAAELQQLVAQFQYEESGTSAPHRTALAPVSGNPHANGRNAEAYF